MVLFNIMILFCEQELVAFSLCDIIKVLLCALHLKGPYQGNIKFRHFNKGASFIINIYSTEIMAQF